MVSEVFRPGVRRPHEAGERCDETFGDQLARIQERSPTWAYIKDLLESTKMTFKNAQERRALLQILELPRENDLDDDFMKQNDKHQRRFHIILGALLQVTGAKGTCQACSDEKRKNSQHKRRTCAGLPPTAAGPEFQDLRSLVDSRCCHCIRSTYQYSSCSFVPDLPANAADPTDESIASEAADDGHTDNGPTDDDDAKDIPTDDDEYADDDPAAHCLAGHYPAQDNSHANSDPATDIQRDISALIHRGRRQLHPAEQRDFAFWVNSIISFSSSRPYLESEFLATLARVPELPAESQANVRELIRRLLSGPIARPE